jgi:sugar lactone lactonase YvrE
MSRAFHRLFLVTACLGAAALASCGSDSTTTPPVDDTPQAGRVYIYAGTARAGYGAVGQIPSKTQLYWPQDVAFAPDGSPVVLDWNNHRVIAVEPSTGRFKLLVGVADGDFGDPCPAAPAACEDIVAVDAKLNHPTHVAFDANGNMILSAWHNSDIFLLDMATGLMDRICGTGLRPCYNGDEQAAVTACIDLPASVAYDPAGRLCFTDQANQIVRMIDEFGIIHTIAGTQPVWNGTTWIRQLGFDGDEGPATSAKVFFESGQIADPSGKICFDAAGNMYIADTRNHAVRVVDGAGIIHRFAGLGPLSGAGQPGFSGDGGPATDAKLSEPRDVAADQDGNIFIADTGNNVIRMVAPDGTISTVVGVPRPINSVPLVGEQALAEDGYAAKDVHLTGPAGVEVDSKGRLWIADTQTNVVRILYR